MTTNKKINIIFFSLSAALILCVGISFYSWNKEKVFSEKYETLPNTLVKYSIDYCRSTGSHLDLKGWIFTDSYPENGKLVITAASSNKEIINQTLLLLDRMFPLHLKGAFLLIKSVSMHLLVQRAFL